MPIDFSMNGIKTQTSPSRKGDGGRDLLSLLTGVAWSSLSAFSPEDVSIAHVTSDSRTAGPGSLFVALPGTRTDGHLYLEQAIQGGCTALVVESGRVPAGFSGGETCCMVEVADSFLACSRIAANFFQHPASTMTMIGVTGTNGKTTVTYLVESVLLQQGLAVGVVGTVNYRYRDAKGRRMVAPAPFTTPEPLLLQRLLREMADAGVSHVIMEVSSHALVQHRLGDLLFDVAAFTNFTRDHLDYHCNMDGYFTAKSLLFRDHLKPCSKVVLSRTSQPDPTEEERINILRGLCAGCGSTVLQCGRAGNSDIYPLEVCTDRDCTRMNLRAGKDEVTLVSTLVGDFNVENLQTAMGIGLALGLSSQLLAALLGHAAGAPGRMERVLPPREEEAFRPAVFVDYAHSPDALEKALQTLSVLPHRRMICVVGCGGDRDKGKRPMMGAIAARACDVVIVTDDNPRSEFPEEIVAAIIDGISSEGVQKKDSDWLMAVGEGEKGFLVLHDRAAAIALAIAAGGKDDIVLIAGKGHEQYQQTLAGRRFFDDRLEARRALTAWSFSSLLAATGGRWLGQEPASIQLGNVVTDSRRIESSDIFVALAGDTFDGHDFLRQVVEAGAGCAVISRDAGAGLDLPSTFPCLLVEDTLQALGALASYRLQLMRGLNRRPGAAGAMVSEVGKAAGATLLAAPLVVGLTGSCGKTTVKEMIATIFDHAFSQDSDYAGPELVLKTRGNFNNLVGLPLSLLPVGPEHKVLVLEMGMNRPGEIAQLVRIADPDIACIVNVHAAHLQGLHSIEGVARAKEEIFSGSRNDTIFAVNLDDPYVRACAEKYRQKKIFYAAGAGGEELVPEVWATDGVHPGSPEQSFVLHVQGLWRQVVLRVPGVHNIANAVAAAAVCHGAGLGIDVIASGLGLFVSADKRMQVVAGRNGLHILNDTYNANPASMRAGIETLARQSCAARIAILGDMLELGPASVAAHREAGADVAGNHITYLALVGAFAEETAAGARDAGLEAGRIRLFNEKQDAAVWVDELCAAGALQAGDWVLVKGSRGMRLETVVELLRRA